MKVITNAKYLDTLKKTWLLALHDVDGKTQVPLCIISHFKDVTKVLATESASRLTSSSRDPEIMLTWKK